MTTEKLHDTSEYEKDAPRDMATRFHDSLKEEHPRALESLNAAVDAGPDYSKVRWLNPKAEPGEAAAEAREIVLGVREFTADLGLQEKREAGEAAADVMTLPLQRAITEFRQANPSDGVPERWGEELSSGEKNIAETLEYHTYMLQNDIVHDRGEKWATHLEGLRETAQDLEFLKSGALDPHHFSKTLIEKDPALAEKLHNAVQEQERPHHWPEWIGDRAAERKAETIFDAFQESVQGTSQTYRDNASSDLAYAMTYQLSKAADDTNKRTIMEDNNKHQPDLQENLARGNLEEFTRNLKQMNRTANMVERYERYGTESPTLQMINTFREDRNTPEKMTAVFNGYVAERDAELAVEPGSKMARDGPGAGADGLRHLPVRMAQVECGRREPEGKPAPGKGHDRRGRNGHTGLGPRPQREGCPRRGQGRRGAEHRPGPGPEQAAGVSERHGRAPGDPGKAAGRARKPGGLGQNREWKTGEPTATRRTTGDPAEEDRAQAG